MTGTLDRLTRHLAARGHGVSRRSPLGTILVTGFGLTFALWIITGIALAIRFDDLDAEVLAGTDRFLAAEQALAEVRSNVLLAGIDWRDALVDNGGSDRQAFYLARLRDYQAASQASLVVLRGRTDIAELQDSLDQLEREVHDYWESILPVIGLPPDQRAADLRRTLSDRILPRRANLVRIVERIQSLNREQLQQQQRREAALYARSRNRFLLTGGFAILISLAAGVFVTRHVRRLDERLRAELAANAENSADLHRLSARVVRAQEDERRLIARELHDEVGQALTAVKMQLAVARRALPEGQSAAIDEARDTADAALQSVRQLSRLLHPPMLEDMGLASALDWYLKGFSERTGIATEVLHAGMHDRPSPEIETCLFRVVQEATTNIARHASATSCRVYVQRLPATVVMTVEDDGQGFDPAAVRARADVGLGLIGIRERVADARGTFTIDSAPGRGTRLTVELPVVSPTGSGAVEGPLAAVGPSRSAADPPVIMDHGQPDSH